LGYEFFDGFSFWLPFPFRQRKVKVVLERLRDAQRRYPGKPISVIAHSFGTYIIGTILRQDNSIQLRRLILCGSILPRNYPWGTYSRSVDTPILNDCGAWDIWPVQAQSTTWGFGASGTWGFRRAGITDRFHNFGHGGFFTADFVRTFWLSWFRGEPSALGIVPPKRPYLWSLITVFPIKWIGALAAASGFGALAAPPPYGSWLGGAALVFLALLSTLLAAQAWVSKLPVWRRRAIACLLLGLAGFLMIAAAIEVLRPWPEPLIQDQWLHNNGVEEHSREMPSDARTLNFEAGVGGVVFPAYEDNGNREEKYNKDGRFRVRGDVTILVGAKSVKLLKFDTDYYAYGCPSKHTTNRGLTVTIEGVVQEPPPTISPDGEINPSVTLPPSSTARISILEDFRPPLMKDEPAKCDGGDMQMQFSWRAESEPKISTETLIFQLPRATIKEMRKVDFLHQPPKVTDEDLRAWLADGQISKDDFQGLSELKYIDRYMDAFSDNETSWQGGVGYYYSSLLRKLVGNPVMPKP
jgi:hypothetical protein